MSQEPSKERFFELLHRASQPQRPTSSRTGALKKSGSYTSKRTHSGKIVNVSGKRRGKSHR